MKNIVYLIFHCLTILFLVTVFNSCNNSESEKKGKNSSCKKCLDFFAVNVTKWRQENINVDSLEVRGCIDCSTHHYDFMVNDSLEVKYGEFIFSKNTRASEIGAIFPESSKLTKPGGNGWKGKIEVFASDRQHEYRVWVLIIHGELLKLMYLYDPFEKIESPTG